MVSLFLFSKVQKKQQHRSKLSSLLGYQWKLGIRATSSTFRIQLLIVLGPMSAVLKDVKVVGFTSYKTIAPTPPLAPLNAISCPHFFLHTPEHARCVMGNEIRCQGLLPPWAHLLCDVHGLFFSMWGMLAILVTSESDTVCQLRPIHAMLPFLDSPSNQTR